MGTIIGKFKKASIFMLITSAGLLLVSGCARYAQNVDTFYQPTANVRGGSGEVYVVIPENRQTHSPNIKWVLGKVKDDDNRIIDEVFSTRSPGEIIQAAFGQEFKRAGYTVVPATTRPDGDHLVIDLTKTEIELEQISDMADLKAKCRLLVGVDLFKNGQQIRRLQYESTSSKTDIKDRDMLARNVLEDALQSIMMKAMPELHALLSR
jgi:hypothetical protein